MLKAYVINKDQKSLMWKIDQNKHLENKNSEESENKMWTNEFLTEIGGIITFMEQAGML